MVRLSDEEGPEAASRLRLLADAGAVFAEERDPNVVLDRIAHLVVETIADAAIVYLIRESKSIDRVVRVHRDPEKLSLLDELEEIAPLRLEDPATQRVLSLGESLHLKGDEIESLTRTPEHRRIVRGLGVESSVFVPMIGRGGPLGIFAAATDGGRPALGDADATVFSQVARRAALVLENSDLTAELRRHGARMAAIAEASRAFSEGSLDFGEVMRRITRTVSESVGDYCSVRLRSYDDRESAEERGPDPAPEPEVAGTGDDDALETGRTVLEAFHHPDEEARRLLRSIPETSLRAGLVGKVLESGEPVFLPSVDPDELQGLIPEHYLRERPIHALIMAPMRARGETIGVVSAWRERAGDPYTEHDRILLQDLADHAALAVENARFYEASQAANRSKAKFLALISHELRTPVNAVVGHADLLEMGIGGELSPDQRKAVERIKINSRHLTRIIDELILYARLDGGEEAIHPTVVSLASVVGRALDDARDEAAAKGLPLATEVPEHIRLSVDSARLHAILLNLLTNAVRFTDEGEVRVRASSSEGVVAVDVVDTGIGIHPRHLAEVFVPFWQAEDPHTRRTGGTGLGLTLSRRLARLMGGDVTGRSEPGVGSTFTLTLPVAPAEGIYQADEDASSGAGREGT